MIPNLVDSDMELDVSNSTRVELYSQHVNPIWVKLLDVLVLNVRYKRAVGAELHTEDGRVVFPSLAKAFIHTSTFSKSSLAMRAGIPLRHSGPTRWS